MIRLWPTGAAALVLAAASWGATAAEVRVKDTAGLRAALKALAPGTAVLVAPGKYDGNNWVSKASGTEREPIVIRGQDPKDPPVFSGGKEAFHFSGCSYLTLADLEVRGCSENGINADDAGTIETPATHLTFENLRIFEIGPKGNHDAIKLSGVCDFLVRNCRIEAWGGQGLDMVGCHRGVVELCHFEGRAGFTPDNAVQMKGGSSQVLVQLCYFKNCGDRAINLGGSTGLPFFRPKAGDCEAREITVAGNRFAGSGAPVAWATADGGRFHHNTVYLPERYALRILQESDDRRFKPCHGGAFENNLVVFDRQLRDFVNVGPGTDPKSFVFRGNAWFEPGGGRKPALPAPEPDGVYGVDPELKDPGLPTMKVGSADPRLKDVGADAYRPEPAK